MEQDRMETPVPSAPPPPCLTEPTLCSFDGPVRPSNRVLLSVPARERARHPESGETLDTQGLDSQSNYLGREKS